MLDDLRDLLAQEPFVRFRIILTSGTVYEVTSPLEVVIIEAKLEYYFPRASGKAIVRLNQIAAFETVD